MKLVLCDQAGTMKRNTDYEVARLKAAFPEAEVAVHVYSNEEALF